MEKEPKSKVRIRFTDCDPFGHLNNTRYLYYLLNAREDHLIDNYDLDMFKLAQEQGVSWVIAKTEIVYKEAAGINEEVIIQTRLIEHHNKWVKIEFVMMNLDQTKIKAIMWGNMVHIDMKTQKSTNHNPELKNLLDTVLIPISASSIEERIINLTNSIL